MPFIIAGAIALSAGASAYASSEASDAQQSAANKAARLERESAERIRADFAPYREAGTSALAKYADAMGLNGDAGRESFVEGFRADPGYRFSFDEGTRAIEGSAAARAGLLSGGAMKALNRFGTGLADQQYGSYLDRFGRLIDTGANATAQTGNSGAMSAGRVGGYALEGGAAKAGGYLGAANAASGAISNGLDLYGRYGGYGGGSGAYNPWVQGGY